jgi:hypothetical protein
MSVKWATVLSRPLQSFTASIKPFFLSSKLSPPRSGPLYAHSSSPSRYPLFHSGGFKILIFKKFV